MELIPWLITLAFAFLLARQTYKPKQALPNTPVQEMLDAPQSNHRLSRVWQNTLMGGTVWNWRCHCGTYGTQNTEADAVASFKQHTNLHQDLARNHYKELYERTAQEFAEFKANCYCKDIT